MSSLHSPSTTRRSTPSRRGRAGLATAAVLLTVAPLAAACGAGFDAASTQVKPDSGHGALGTLKVNNVWVIVDPNTNNAEVIGAVSNTGSTDVSWPDVQVGGAPAQIVAGGASGSAAAGGSGAPAQGAAHTIGAGQTAYFGQPGQPQIEFSAAGLTLGDLTRVTFSFGDTGTVTIPAQIEPNTGEFADYNPNPASASPSASASTSAKATASASASSSASTSASATASVSASASATPTK